MEQQRTHPYRALFNSDQVHRIYLNELGQTEQLPLGIALMVLTTVAETEAPKVARNLLKRTRQEITEPLSNRAIIELVTTIMLYKFATLSRAEVEAMLDTNITLQETRVYQEIKAEGEQWGREQEATLLILRQLARRLKQELSDEVRSQITTLPLSQLENLGEALLDFNTLEDLLMWLQANAT